MLSAEDPKSKDAAIVARTLFPYTPYAVQTEFVTAGTSLLTSPNDGNQAHVGIFESPTGTGKTTSLLCSALAWLLEKSPQENESLSASNEPEWIRKARLEQEAKIENAPPPQKKSKRGSRIKNDEEELDPVQKLLKMIDADKSSEKANSNITNYPVPVKRVYYASRTHSQLAQVMKELRRILSSPSGTSQLQSIRAVSLSSRKSLCINRDINRLGSTEAINDGCQQLLEKGKIFS